AFCELHDVVLYGQASDGSWASPLGASEDATNYHALQIGVRLPGDVDARSSENLAHLLEQVRERARSLGALLTEARYPLESAVTRAAELGRLRDFIEQQAEGCVDARVARPNGFQPEEIERVLAGIGFDARRGGLFTWSNQAGCL